MVKRSLLYVGWRFPLFSFTSSFSFNEHVLFLVERVDIASISLPETGPKSAGMERFVFANGHLARDLGQAVSGIFPDAPTSEGSVRGLVGCKIS